MTLILKLTDQCNLRCKYCSVGKKDHPMMLSEDKIKLALEQFARLSARKFDEPATVIFHGGEPAIVPAGLYDRVITYTTESYPYINFRWCMQTNGTILNAEWIDVIKKHDISVGVSIDGNRDIHNKNRVYKNGRGTYDTVVKNIKEMLKNDIQTAALFVFTGINGDLTVGNILGDIIELGIPLKINPLVECGMAVENKKISAVGYADFLAEVFRYITNNNITIPINPIDDIFNAMIHDKSPSECVYSQSCGSGFIAVDQFGDIYPCGKFSDAKECVLGNIESTTMIEAADDPIMKNLSKRRHESESEDCNSCNYKQLCNFGCPAAFSSGNSKEHLCGEYKRLYKFLATTGVEIYSRNLMQLKPKQESDKTVFEAYMYPFEKELADEIVSFENNNMLDIHLNAQNNNIRRREFSDSEVFIIARKGPSIIGMFSFIIYEDSKLVDIKSMQIASAYRKTRMFHKLIKMAFHVYEDIRSDRFLPEIVKLSVHNTNKYALKLYQKFGFVFNSEQKDSLLAGKCDYDSLIQRIKPMVYVL